MQQQERRERDFMSSSDAPEVLAVVPARGGSKRLPRKNVRSLAGHPMIAYTIMAGQTAELVTDLVVSSEDDEILNIAQKYDVTNIIERPRSLATDDVRNIEVVMHALDLMESRRGASYDIIVLLQPTAPIRSAKHIDDAVLGLWRSDLPTLAAVKGPFRKRDPILKRINSKGELVEYRDDPNRDPREAFYIYNAALYAVKREYFVKERRLTSEKQVPLIMDQLHSTDVDELADFETAEALINAISEGRI